MNRTQVVSIFCGSAFLSVCAVGLAFAFDSKVALGAELAGVKFEDSITQDGKTLNLNGLGLRKKAIFKVYVGGLYLEKKEKNPQTILETTGPKVVMLKFLRDVDAKSMKEAILNGFENNCINKCEAFKAEVTKLIGLISNIKEGHVLKFTLKPEVVSFEQANSVVGDVAKPGFGKEFLKLFIGENPPQEALKEGLLGID